MIVLHELPFCIVEYEGFRNFVQSLNPLFKPICRNTAKSDCMRLYDEQRSALHEVFKNCNGRVSLTADMWSSKQTLGHLCITCRFIDNEWKIQKTCHFIDNEWRYKKESSGFVCWRPLTVRGKCLMLY